MHLFFSANPLVIKIFAHVHHVPNNYYRPQRSSEGYVFTRVCHSVHRGVCLSACWDTTPQEQTPPEQTPPGGDPLEQTPPREQIPRSRHPQTATVADGTHPTGMHSCYRSAPLNAAEQARNNIYY